MLNVKNIVIANTTVSGASDNEGGGSTSNLNGFTGRYGKLAHLKGLLDIKCAAYLRLCASKNAINRAVDYHYLGMAVTGSTEPRNDIDYIHPVVKPVVDYSTAVISKGLLPNGELDFEFVPDTEEDDVAARQATEMVAQILNANNDPHKIIHEWIQDALMHKNGMMMVQPIREKIVKYQETQGTADQLKAFELQAEEAGLKVQRQSRRKINIDMQRVQAEVQQGLQQTGAENQEATLQTHMDNLKQQVDAIGTEEEVQPEQAGPTPDESLDQQQSILDESIARNTIYSAKYKLTGYNLNLRLQQVAQHYWICDPTVTEIQEQPFCGFYAPMAIQVVMELYPDIDLEEFRKHAEYNQNGAYQAGSVLNNLSIHSRDSVPIAGIPVNAAASSDPDARMVTVLTVWDRYDIDGDGELELIEIVCSGSYIISAKEVEFIPIGNMNPKPLPGNFFGMSIGESVIPMQEYMTAQHRAELQLGLLQSTARIGVKPDRVDFEQMMDGEAAIFILDSKFDPSTDVYPMPVPNGNLTFITDSMNRMQQDTMNISGMTSPADTFNPEVMAPGNSGIKLQMALTPAQLVQDDTVKNAAEGIKEIVWLVWRTLIQYADDWGVKKLAQRYNPNKEPVFLDAKAFDDFNFCERKQIHLALALGMMSEENRLQRLEVIKKTQTELYQKTEAMATAGTLTPSIYKKIAKPYEDTLYTLGVKDCNVYLPTEEEVQQMIQQGQEAAKNKQPSPDDQNKLSQAKLNNAKTIEIEANLDGTSAEKQLEYLQIASGHSAANVD